MEKVSAIITTHNRLSKLKNAIKSVQNQTYKNIELIIIDDNSSDGTKQYCEKLQNVKYIYIPKSESKGGNYARNLGIKESTGDFIAFLDDDDEWLLTKIEKQLNYIKKTGIPIVYCGRKFIVNNGALAFDELPNKQNMEDCSKKILFNIIGVTSMFLFRRDVLTDDGWFDINLGFWQEYDLMIRLCQKYKIGYINEVLINYSYNLNDKNRLTNKVDQWFECVEYINKKNMDLINNLTLEERKKREIMICYDAVSRYSSQKNNKMKRKYLFKIFIETHKLKDFVKAIFNVDKNSKIKFQIFIKRLFRRGVKYEI